VCIHVLTMVLKLSLTTGLLLQQELLGRVPIKEGSGETQSNANNAVSNAMLKERWCPSAILPPQKMYAPSPKHTCWTDLSDVEDDVDDSMDSSSDELMSSVKPTLSEQGEQEQAAGLYEEIYLWRGRARATTGRRVPAE
jgi:hypothetical protein